MVRQGANLIPIATDIPASLHDLVKRRFEGKQIGENAFQFTPQNLLAFKSHFASSVRVDESIQTWLNEQLSYKAVLPRISPWVNAYKGGFQSPIIARTVANKQMLIGAAPGAGKTMIGLELACMLKPMVAVIPPLIVDNAWMEDGRQFYTSGGKRLTVALALGGQSNEERKAILRSKADLYIVSPFLLGGLVDELLDLPKVSVLGDELTMYRNPNSVLSKSMHRLAKTAEYRIGLSGNPSPRHAGEFWSQMQFISPGSLGSYEQFGKEYGRRTRYGFMFDDEEKSKLVLDRVKDHVELIPKEKFWPDAPPQKHYVVPVDMTPEQRKRYDEFREAHRATIGGKEIIADEDMTRTMKLREITCGFVYDERKHVHMVGSSKYDALANLIRNVIGGEQVMVWCHFTEEVNIVERCLQRWGVSYVVLDKQQGGKASADKMTAFQSRQVQVLVSHPKTAGHGLRFPQCRNMIFMSLDYDIETYEQALSRIHRPPQTRECRYFYIVAKDSIDEKLYNVCRGLTSWYDACREVLER